MSLLLDDEYFHFGTDILYKELWGKIQMIHKSNYTKPIGGLWTSPVNSYYLCDWLRYREFRDRYNFDLFVANQKSSLVKFKSDAKLLNISTENDFKNLKDSGFVTTLDEPIKLYTCDKPIYELPDYEKISEYYDLMYVDYFVHECFTQYCVNTMLAINSSAVEYYKSLDVDYLNHTINSISEKKYIIEPNKEYYEFLKYVRELLGSIDARSYDEFIEKLNKLKRSIIEDLEKNFDFSKLNLPKGIDINKFVIATSNNIFSEKCKLGKKLFNK